MSCVTIGRPNRLARSSNRSSAVLLRGHKVHEAPAQLHRDCMVNVRVQVKPDSHD